MSKKKHNDEALPRVLSIAGSDPSGGAGIQADLKTFQALGCYGMAAITAVTVQNTRGVTGVVEIPAEIVAQQIEAVLSDIGADVVKIGMLANAEIIEAVAQTLVAHGIEKIVLDPVMVAKSGDRLLATEAESALRTQLMPIAYCVTPNAPEAAALCGCEVNTLDDVPAAAQAIFQRGALNVVIKGGHLPGDEVVDTWYNGTDFKEIRGPRIHTPHTHGTGCTYASAIAAYLARGAGMHGAIKLAREYLEGAIQNAPGFGGGHGPVYHGWTKIPVV